ncbi:MAG: hypothetical protein RLZ95_244 [Bacteroidota bacterium]|jgi:hypothetical protein
MIKLPKAFNKMTLSEQENYLVKKLLEYYKMEEDVKRMLSKIRGGNKVIVKEVDRPDEAVLKNEN